MEKWISTLNNKEYDIKDVARVPDKMLQTLYIKAGLRPVDMYAGLDNNGKDIIVMLFLKSESKPYYEKWLNHTLADHLKSVEEQDG